MKERAYQTPLAASDEVFHAWCKVDDAPAGEEALQVTGSEMEIDH